MDTPLVEPQIFCVETTKLMANSLRIITDLNELGERLQLPLALIRGGEEAAKQFPLALPESLLPRIKIGDAHDPVLLQFLPQANELKCVEGFSDDPLQESTTNSLGFLQKYQHRILLLTSGHCRCACRYCFRRHSPKTSSLLEKGVIGKSPSEQTAFYDTFFRSIRDDASIREIILSGGDPLSLSDDVIMSLLDYIKLLPFVNRVRFHTRAPFVSPGRMNENLVNYFQKIMATPKKTGVPFSIYFVFQINHPQELDESVERMLQSLRRVGVVLLAQSVLLRGINDHADTLCRLFEQLVDLGVLPYYLHQLDKVAGASSFEVDSQEGIALMNELSARLPGYAVPRYVREIPSQAYKIPLQRSDR